MSVKLTAVSLKRLEGVHPHLVSVIKRAAEISTIQFQVTCGVRTLSAQRKLVAIGASRTLKSRHIAEDQRQMREGAEKFRALYRDLAPQEVDQTTVTITELMKTVLLGMVTGSKSTKEALELARAIQATVAAQKGSLQQKRKLMGETKERTLDAIDKVGKAVAQTPDSAALIKKIREDIYGIFDT